MKLPDIDIDTPSNFDGGIIFPSAIRASRVAGNSLLPHPSGYYFENIPIDPITNLSAIPFKQADEYNYFKVDLLHNSVYDFFESHAEIKAFLEIEPDWTMLEYEENIIRLSQVHNHVRIVRLIKPTSIDDLADVLAIIRPAKRHLLYPYIRNEIERSELYTKSVDLYQFRKSHSIAYAHVIVLQMHLLSAGLL